MSGMNFFSLKFEISKWGLGKGDHFLRGADEGKTICISFSEHEKLLNRLITNCLMGSGKTSSPLQIVLNKVC